MTDQAHAAMRRREKEITRLQDLETILQSAGICRLAMANGNVPYIVPMNFGYRDHTLYFHCAPEGRKLEFIRKNPMVCFEADCDTKVVNTGKPCNWSSRYTSIIGYGTATLVDDLKRKRDALNIIVDHYAPGTAYVFPDENVEKVAILKVEITHMTGKKSELETQSPWR